MNRWAWLGLLVTVAVALFLRVGDLALRPLHNDEAINAFKLQKLWTAGTYTYDPHEYHGPTLPYASLPVLAVAARFRPDQPDEASMRTVPLVFGVGLILLLGGVAGALGARSLAVVLGGLLTAVSPAMVYFSRYYIHELLLVFFTAAVLAAFWRYQQRPGPGWAALAGAGVGAMYATKETFVLPMAAMAAAWCVTVATGRRGGEAAGAVGGVARRALGRVREALGEVPWAHVAWAAGAALIVFGLLFTSFFGNPAGVIDAVRTYLPWGDRAGGASPHIHPWDFYFERLGWWGGAAGKWRWSETAVVVLAVWGGVRTWRREPTGDGSAIRFLGCYTVVLAGLYAAIPYKTPWCFLGFLHGVLVLAGVGAASLFRRRWHLPVQVVLGAVLAWVVVDQARWAWRYSREMAADFRNPFVYGHTSADLFNLLDQVRDVASVHPEGQRMPIEVMAPEANYWPLPWYLRRFEQVGWWDHLPEKPVAPVIVAAVKLKAGLEETSHGAWRLAGMFELRPRYFVELYVEAGLWKRFLERPEGRAPAGP